MLHQGAVARGSSSSTDLNTALLPKEMSKDSVDPVRVSPTKPTPSGSLKQQERGRVRGKDSQREMNNNSHQRYTVQTYKIISASSESGEDQVKTSPYHTPVTNSAQM